MVSVGIFRCSLYCHQRIIYESMTVIRGSSMQYNQYMVLGFWGYREVDDCGRFLNLKSFKLYGNAEVQTFHALQHESADRKLWWGQSRCDQMLFMSVR